MGELALDSNMHSCMSYVSLQIEYTEGMTMFDGEHYESKYITFHRPSEHFISAKQFELELQVHHVHILDASKRLAVVVMFVLSMNDNLLLEELEFDDLPTRAGDSKVLSAPFNLEHGMPMNPDYFVYDGSLTQPPCTEGVKFVVLNERPTLSAKQVDNDTTPLVASQHYNFAKAF
jgi:carbonic anhydrase